MQPGSPTALRRHNRDLILKLIVENRALSRTEIARQTGLTGAAVSRITRELIDAGLLKEGATIALKGRAGRRNVRLELSGKGAYVLGITLTRNARTVSIADCRGNAIARVNVGPVDLGDPYHVLDRVGAVARKLMDDTEFDRSRLLGAGVSVAGRANPETGDLISGAPLGWSELPLGRILSEALALPTRVEGRAVALLRAELSRGLAMDKANVVLINNGLLIGGSAAIDGRVACGKDHMLGQIAHLAIKGDTTPCACGRQGCLDAIASGEAILTHLAAVEIPGLRRKGNAGVRLAAAAALRGPEHKAVTRVFRRAGRTMGYAVDTIFSILNPELVLLAGVVGRHPDYLAGVRETLARVRGEDCTDLVQASAVTSDESAIWLGLGAFVYSQQLDIDQLKAA